ncbi:MAG TPA: response regulator [Acidimicrobiales bacterium]|nr:response regulator [Acidimicrobiales bacterium]
MTTTIRTLIVDDDFQVASIHADYVNRIDNFTVAGVAHTADAAAEAVQQLHPDLILLDLYLPDESGLSLLARLRDGPGPHPDVIAITAARDMASVRSAMKLGAFHYLVKPFRLNVLAERLDAYRRLWERTNRLQEADQHDVDSLFGLLRTSEPAPLPKGHSAPTLALVRDVFQAGNTELSAAEVAKQVGISRPTAQRYLAHLVRSGLLELHLRYGTTGRPEHRYRRGR